MRYDNNCAGSRWWRWVESVGSLMDGMDRMAQAVVGLGGRSKGRQRQWPAKAKGMATAASGKKEVKVLAKII